MSDSAYGTCAWAVLVSMLALWGANIQINDPTFIDVFWGIGFAMQAFLCIPIAHYSLHSMILFSILSVWAIRLSRYLYRRWRTLGPDRRYTRLLRRLGGNPVFTSFFAVFLMQGIIMWIVGLPIQQAASSRARLSLRKLFGAGIAILGLLIESLADWQLARFRGQGGQGKVMNTGLWRYSRHPNHFGNSVLWWGIYLFTAPRLLSWTIISPILMTVLLLAVSGVPTVEATMRRRPGYRRYVKTTSRFIPWCPSELPEGEDDDEDEGRDERGREGDREAERSRGREGRSGGGRDKRSGRDREGEGEGEDEGSRGRDAGGEGEGERARSRRDRGRERGGDQDGNEGQREGQREGSSQSRRGGASQRREPARDTREQVQNGDDDDGDGNDNNDFADAQDRDHDRDRDSTRRDTSRRETSERGTSRREGKGDTRDTRSSRGAESGNTRSTAHEEDEVRKSKKEARGAKGGASDRRDTRGDETRGKRADEKRAPATREEPRGRDREESTSEGTSSESSPDPDRSPDPESSRFLDAREDNDTKEERGSGAGQRRGGEKRQEAGDAPAQSRTSTASTKDRTRGSNLSAATKSDNSSSKREDKARSAVQQRGDSDDSPTSETRDWQRIERDEQARGGIASQ